MITAMLCYFETFFFLLYVVNCSLIVAYTQLMEHRDLRDAKILKCMKGWYYIWSYLCDYNYVWMYDMELQTEVFGYSFLACIVGQKHTKELLVHCSPYFLKSFSFKI